jgi:hypothetical protein
MSGVYAEAMENKLHQMLDWWRDVYGVEFVPRVVGPSCPLPWHCGWPMEHYPCATPAELGGFVWTCRKCGGSEVVQT